MARSPIVIAVLAVAAFGALATRTAFEAGHLAEDARQLRLRGQAARAAQASARAVELDAGRATYWNGLGLANAADPRHMRDAVTAFGRAADLAPWEVTYLTNLARAQLSLAQAGAAEWRDRALASARLAVERDPQYGEPYFTLSLVVVSSGNARDGIAAFERGIALQGAPRDPQAFYVAGRAYIDLKRFADASSVLRTAILALPEADRIAARFQLARALAAQGQTTEALVELAIVLGADPSNEAARALRDELTRSAP
jgi:tetratricopeptide (TPR) repeat protein